MFPSPGHNLLDYPIVYNNLEAPAYQGLYALGEYEGILKGLINQLKFSRKPLAAKVLATFYKQYLFNRMRINQTLPDALIPIPLSYLRHVNRQYNQSRLLSQTLGELFDITVIDALKRVKNTQQQSQLSKEDRQTNISNAFRIHQDININSIAIIDDVVTTGATVNEACKLILQTYPDVNIQVWCMAVTIL